MLSTDFFSDLFQDLTSIQEDLSVIRDMFEEMTITDR